MKTCQCNEQEAFRWGFGWPELCLKMRPRASAALLAALDAVT